MLCQKIQRAKMRRLTAIKTIRYFYNPINNKENFWKEFKED